MNLLYSMSRSIAIESEKKIGTNGLHPSNEEMIFETEMTDGMSEVDARRTSSCGTSFCCCCYRGVCQEIIGRSCRSCRSCARNGVGRNKVELFRNNHVPIGLCQRFSAIADIDGSSGNEADGSVIELLHVISTSKHLFDDVHQLEDEMK